MSIIDLYEDYGVAFQTEGHKHCRPGWVNIECPFCTGNPGLHLGCNVATGHFYCWRCGWKPTDAAIAKILHISKPQARDLIRKYRVRRGRPTISNEAANATIALTPFKLPSNTGPLTEAHKGYLRRRGFDPDYLVEEWGLMGTGPVSYLDKIDYKHRIIIPIHWGGKMVSFQARDITGKSALRYISCPKTRELIHHKEILYGKDWDRDTGICVEGPTDVWRLGPMAFATFGITYTPKQVRLMARLFKRVVVLFDNDPQAIEQGKQLVAELGFRGVDAWQENIKGDPADLPQAEADYLVRNVT